MILTVQNSRIDLSDTDFKNEYLDNTKYLAVQTASKYNLFASVVLAQSALESNYGKSELSSVNNNYFGIKKGSSENYVEYNTTEYINGRADTVYDAFRTYNSKEDSFEDYAKLITKAKRYKTVIEASDYKEACYRIQNSGYATDPNYAEKIISIIEKYSLYELD